MELSFMCTLKCTQKSKKKQKKHAKRSKRQLIRDGREYDLLAWWRLGDVKKSEESSPKPRYIIYVLYFCVTWAHAICVFLKFIPSRNSLCVWGIRSLKVGRVMKIYGFSHLFLLLLGSPNTWKLCFSHRLCALTFINFVP